MRVFTYLGSFIKRIWKYIVEFSRLLRVRQWLKNVAVFAPVIFSGQLFNILVLQRASLAMIAFCFLSSSHYIVNDILDVVSDRLHPVKKNRPLARKSISLPIAWDAWLVCTITGGIISLFLGRSFFIFAVLYVSIHYLFLFWLRRVPILDILLLATGYVFRIYAGEIATHTNISIWLALSALSLALLFALGKRRYETANGGKPLYSIKLLDEYLAMFATATFVSYAYFTFVNTFTINVTKDVAETLYAPFLVERKWLMATLPFVLYGLMRYLQRIYLGGNKLLIVLLLTDIPLLLTVAGWGVTVLVVIYGIGR